MAGFESKKLSRRQTTNQGIRGHEDMLWRKKSRIRSPVFVFGISGTEHRRTHPFSKVRSLSIWKGVPHLVERSLFQYFGPSGDLLRAPPGTPHAKVVREYLTVPTYFILTAALMHQ